MRNILEEKIKAMQNQPESVRIRTALILTACVTIIIILVWVALLLPAQLRISAH